MRSFKSFQQFHNGNISGETLDKAIEAAESLLSEMRRQNDPLPEQCGGYLLVRKLIDDEDLADLTYAEQIKKMRRNHNRLFFKWLRGYRIQVKQLHRERVATLAAAGRWPEIPAVLRRYGAYALLCFRLRMAGFFRLARVGNPTQMVMNCIAELRVLDRCPVISIQSSASPAE